MIPLEEYLAARRRFHGRSGWEELPCVLGFLVGSLLFSATESLFRPGSNESAPLAATIVGACLFAAASIAGVYWTVRLQPRKKQFPNPACPHDCEKLMQDMSGVVVATGKCPTCLKHVVKVDPKATDVNMPLLTLAQLQLAKRWQWRAGVTIVLSISLATLVLALFGISSSFLYASGAISRETHETVFWLGRWGFGTTLFIGPILAVAIFFSCCQIRCPKCRMSVPNFSTVIASGNCPLCSAAIVQDAVPHSEYRPLPKMATVEKALHRFNVRWTIYLASGGSIACLLLLGAVQIDKAFLQQRVEPSVNLVRLAMYLVAILASLMAFLAPFAFRRFNRYPELVCHSCRRAIYGNSSIVRCTGNCPHCGQRVIKDV